MLVVINVVVYNATLDIVKRRDTPYTKKNLTTIISNWNNLIEMYALIDTNIKMAYLKLNIYLCSKSKQGALLHY